MSDVGQRTIAALARFVEQFRADEPRSVTVVTREHTPDGPLTTARSITIRPSELQTDAVSRAIKAAEGDMDD